MIQEAMARLAPALAAVVASWGLAGCGPSDATKDSADPAGSAAPAANAAAASASAAKVDMGPFCAKLCKRSADCGLELAEAIAKNGPAADKQALEKAKAERDAVEKACVTACEKTPAGEDPDPATLRQATKCLDAKTCTEFQSCLTDAGRNP